MRYEGFRETEKTMMRIRGDELQAWEMKLFTDWRDAGLAQHYRELAEAARRYTSGARWPSRSPLLGVSSGADNA